MTGELEHRVAGDRPHAWMLESGGDRPARLEWRQDVEDRPATGWHLVRDDGETRLHVDPAIDALARDAGRDAETWSADADLLAHLTTGAALDAAEQRLTKGTARASSRDLVGGRSRDYAISVTALDVDALALAFPALAVSPDADGVMLRGSLSFADLTAVVSRIRTLGGGLAAVVDKSRAE
jgi:hypothetical protein